MTLFPHYLREMARGSKRRDGSGGKRSLRSYFKPSYLIAIAVVVLGVGAGFISGTKDWLASSPASSGPVWPGFSSGQLPFVPQLGKPVTCCANLAPDVGAQKVALVTTIKRPPGDSLLQWLCYHFRIGFTHAYVYLDDPAEEVAPSPPSPPSLTTYLLHALPVPLRPSPRFLLHLPFPNWRVPVLIPPVLQRTVDMLMHKSHAVGFNFSCHVASTGTAVMIRVPPKCVRIVAYSTTGFSIRSVGLTLILVHSLLGLSRRCGPGK